MFVLFLRFLVGGVCGGRKNKMLLAYFCRQGGNIMLVNTAEKLFVRSTVKLLETYRIKIPSKDEWFLGRDYREII